jgi:hypothetical protein
LSHVTTAVPGCGSASVVKALWSTVSSLGKPVGMILPLLNLSPFRLSIQMRWKLLKSERRISG